MKRPFLLALGWAWAAAIVWLSLTPSPPELEFAESDKAGHGLSYALLMFWFAVLHPGWKTRGAHAALFVAMGIALELAQGALGYRTFEALDMLANSVGVLLGWTLAAIALRLRRTV